jgi:hypothetical protein
MALTDKKVTLLKIGESSSFYQSQQNKEKVVE